MQLRQLGTTGIDIAPLVLGANVFGWTADKATSFAILDAFIAAGFNAIDTADVYSRFHPGNVGGESETIIGEWINTRGVRGRVVVITKLGLEMGEGMKGLGRDYVRQACEASLKRLRIDAIDVYLAHRADPEIPIEETLEAFQRLIAAGKVRHAGCSNYKEAELAAALAAGGGDHARYAVLQPHYNLLVRDLFEGALEQLSVSNNLGVIPYYALAAGFLTGKYRNQQDFTGARAQSAARYFDARGIAILQALDRVAGRHGATPAQVALAWLMARPSVTAPIASATSVQQLAEILKSTELHLEQADFDDLDI